jgi:hypothetical protein
MVRILANYYLPVKWAKLGVGSKYPVRVKVESPAYFNL